MDKVDQALLHVTPPSKEKKKQSSATKVATKPILKKISSVLRIKESNTQSFFDSPNKGIGFKLYK